MFPSSDSDLIRRFLADEATPAELPAVRVALRRRAEQRGIAPDWLAASADTERIDPFHVEAAFARLRDTIAQHERRPLQTATVGPSLGSQRTSNARHAIFAIAMSVVGVLLMAGGTLFWRTSASRQAPQHYRTAPGQQSTVRLADGSSIHLAPATQIVVTPQVVTVQGEAYFTIAAHAGRPFVVQTENATIRVLGTRFAVRQYTGEHTSRVVVEDGKVALGRRYGGGSDSTPTVLATRTLGEVTDSGVVVTTGIAVEDYTSWHNGHLVFRHAPVRDVIVELARAYGTTIQLADTTVANQRVTIEALLAEDSVTDVLDFLTRAVGAHYQRVGQRFVIAAGRASTPKIRPTLPQSPLPSTPEIGYGR